jgi:hypothetical protein
MANGKQGSSSVRTASRWAVSAGIAALSVISVNARADSKFVSGSSQAHLIELYTSEGCSSCPPADRWLSSLKEDPLLWSRMVPVAFHVDYWDYLGWRDDYARAEFSERQQRYARLKQVSGVYTPGMFLDGQEWREWQSSNALSGRKAAGNSQVGRLTLNYERQRSTLSFAPEAEVKQAPRKAYLALLGVNVDSPIKAGENRGKRLRHDFVVLDLVSADLKRSEDGGLMATLPAITTELTAPKYAVAAWVTNANDSQPLQVTGGWLQP